MGFGFVLRYYIYHNGSSPFTVRRTYYVNCTDACKINIRSVTVDLRYSIGTFDVYTVNKDVSKSNCYFFDILVNSN